MLIEHYRENHHIILTKNEISFSIKNSNEEQINVYLETKL